MEKESEEWANSVRSNQLRLFVRWDSSYSVHAHDGQRRGEAKRDDRGRTASEQIMVVTSNHQHELQINVCALRYLYS